MFWKTACALFLLFCHLLVFLQRWIRVISDNQMIFLRQFPPPKRENPWDFPTCFGASETFQELCLKREENIDWALTWRFCLYVGGVVMDHWKSKRVPEKHLLLLYWLRPSLWLCGSQQTGKFFKRWEYQTTWPASWETYMQVRKQQLELDTEQQTCSK